ncbi:15095_t:CDS:2, partial [Cetraspora pellucida]
ATTTSTIVATKISTTVAIATDIPTVTTARILAITITEILVTITKKEEKDLQVYQTEE